jgi:tRNA modification GTPase
MSAYASLGEIIGEEISEDLANEIFSKFCMGK